MRKELSIIMESSEKEIFFSIRRDVSDESRILLTFEGMKLSFDASEMQVAILELNNFYKDPNETVEEVKPKQKISKKPTSPTREMFPVHEED